MKKIFAIIILIFFLYPSAVFAKKSNKPVIPDGSGYVGTLPNLSERFQKSQTQEAEPAFQYEDNFGDKDDIKPAPRNNPAFINIIMKKDKTSQYINDLNSLISIIENLETSVENQDDIQKFNAQAYFFKVNAEFFRDKYKNKAEGSYNSFKKVMQLNTHVQAVSQLRREREVYSPYLTGSGSGNTFSQNNINNQLDYLNVEIKDTLVILKADK